MIRRIDIADLAREIGGRTWELPALVRAVEDLLRRHDATAIRIEASAGDDPAPVARWCVELLGAPGPREVNRGARTRYPLPRAPGALVHASDYHDDARVRAEPFEVFELELDVLWAGGQLADPPR